MIRRIAALVVLMAALGWCMGIAAADTSAGAEDVLPQAASGEPNMFSLPEGEGPVVVTASFELRDINEINDEAETFEFTGVLTLSWHDSRLSFDPSVEGVSEIVFTGAYQFNEIAPGWYPQLILVNEAGMLEKSGVVMRVRPDGIATLIETVNAVAESEFQMRRLPFDRQRLEAVFEVLGFNDSEVQLQVESGAANSPYGEIRLPEWTIEGVDTSIRTGFGADVENRGNTSALIMGMDVERKPFFILRLVVLPLIVIVLLSFSIFWMERSSLGDRISVSFIGILTAVSYQIVMSEPLPQISYFTLMHGFLYFSFLTMCATVVINLVVGALDKRGQYELGDRVDRRCRWIFPLTYFGILLVMLAAAFLFF